MISLIEFVVTVGSATLTAAGASHGWQLLRQSQIDRTQRQAPSRQKEKTGRPSAGAWHTPRQGRRHHIRCQINYLTPEGPTNGTLVDISRQGWRAVGERPVTRGTVLSLRVYLPDQSTPLEIEVATVRWTDGNEFGLELTTLRPEAAARLSEYLGAHLPRHETVSPYELSPFSYN
jgi:PilZ domain